MKRLLSLLCLAALSGGCQPTAIAPLPPADPQAPAVAVEGPTGTQVGDLAPAISFQDLDGGAHSLAEFRGKSVLLTFFASWCPHCQVEVPRLQAAVQRLAADDFVFVPLEASNGSATDVTNFNRLFGITVPTYLDPPGDSHRAFGVDGFPTSYRLDAGGRVVDSAVGEIPPTALGRFVPAKP